MSSNVIYTTLSTRISEKYSNLDLSEYFDFCITNSLSNKIKFETSDHHILPKWAFPEYKSFKDFSWNKATLYHKDHIKAHFLLWKAWRVSENASPLLLMCNIYKNEITESYIEEYSELYHLACRSHGERVSQLHTGKTVTQETKNKMRKTVIKNAEANRGMVYCINSVTGSKEHVSVEEYHKNKGIIYKSFVADKPAWNSGKEMPQIQGMLTVLLAGTEEKVRITTEEYANNKHLYTHMSEGKTVESLTGYVLVTEISTGDIKRIPKEEYHSNKDKYEFHAKGTIWVNSGEESIRISENDVIPDGYVIGRLKFKVTRPIRTCPHCGLVGKGSNMSRYHFDNCKLKGVLIYQ